MTFEEALPLFVIGFIIGAFILGCWVAFELQENIDVLGSAICEEEFNTTYYYYSDNKGLVCKPFPNSQELNYDGLRVTIEKATIK